MSELMDGVEELSDGSGFKIDRDKLDVLLEEVKSSSCKNKVRGRRCEFCAHKKHYKEVISKAIGSRDSLDEVNIRWSGKKHSMKSFGIASWVPDDIREAKEKKQEERRFLSSSRDRRNTLSYEALLSIAKKFYRKDGCIRTEINSWVPERLHVPSVKVQKAIMTYVEDFGDLTATEALNGSRGSETFQELYDFRLRRLA